MKRSDADEHDLIERFRRDRSEGALGALLGHVEPDLARRLRRRIPAKIRRKVSESDILQEAYLVAVQRIDAFEDRGDGAFAAWMRQIVDLKLREAIRKYRGTRKRGDVNEVSRGGRPETQQFAGRIPTPSQVAVAGELHDRTERAMRELPSDYREILRLVQAEGLTLRVAAERMGRSREAAKKLYSRALARLAELLPD